MYLSTIKTRESDLNYYRKSIRDVLKTADINMKKPPKKTRPSNSLITNDIYIKPLKYFQKINYPFDRFTNNDIEGTKS